MKYTYGDVLRAFHNGNVTDSGIAFTSYLSGPEGAHYILLPIESNNKHTGHTKAQIMASKLYCRANFDVTGIDVCPVARPSDAKIEHAQKLAGEGASNSDLWAFFK